MSKAPKGRALAALAVLTLAVLGAAGPAAGEPPLTSKEAQAERVLAEIREIDSAVARAAEAYNAATIELDEILVEQRQNRTHLVVARTNLGRAQRALQERLVALYTGQGGESALEIVLGASSLEDMLNGLEAAQAVSNQDTTVLRQVRGFRSAVKNRKGELAVARVKQAQIVSERAAHKAEVERQLAERQALLGTIREEIARLRAEEQARQLAAARLARLRLEATPPAPLISGAPVVEYASPDLVSLPSARYGGAVGIAMQYLGIPYQWGGSSPLTGFDCSGFVMYVFGQIGVGLPHNAAAQFSYGTPVSQAELQPGDLVFFDGLGHNGIYIGGGQFIHSPHTGDVVKVSSLSDPWYAGGWIGGRRL